jgi:multidrug resistance protein, MATE family
MRVTGALRWPARDDFRTVVSLAVPVVAVQVGLSAMGLIDTLMVGRVSAPDLAAVALGNLFFFMVAVFGMGLLMGLDPLVSQAVGAQDPTGAAIAMQRGVVLAVALTFLAGAGLLLAEPAFRLAAQPDEVIPIAVRYALWSIPGVLPFYLFVVLRQSLQAMSRVAPIVWTIIGANLLNVALNWVLIWGNLGAPRLGAVGSSIASSISRWGLVVLLVAIAWPLLKPYLQPIRPGILRLRALVGMVRLGAPIGAQLQLEFGAFAMVGVAMGWLGTESMAGHQVALTLAAFAFMVPVGVAAAAAVHVGHGVGGERLELARRSASASLLLGLGFMATTALLFLVFPRALSGLFTVDPGTLVIAAALLPIAGVFQIFDGLQAVSAGILRGVGDTRVPMLANALGFWILGIPLGLLLAFPLSMGAEGLWWGLAIGLAIVSILLLLRVRNQLGKELRRVEVE